MILKILIWLACSLIPVGIFLVFLSFRAPSKKTNKKKLLRIGGVGVILALAGGLILICSYYATQPISTRIIEEHLEKNYPDKPTDISMQNKALNLGKYEENQN